MLERADVLVSCGDIFDAVILNEAGVIHGHQHIDRETRLGTTRIVGVYGQKRLDIQ